MASQADVFEPDVVRGTLKGLLKSAQAKEKFEKDWKADVDKRISSWSKHKDNKATPLFQLEWEAEVIQYVDYLYSKLSVHGNASTQAKDAILTLDKAIPLMGPQFSPPSFLHTMRRKATPAILPQQAYIKSITVVHPVFYPTTFTSCPKCESATILWDSWNGTGARTVYGIRINERAIGYQLRCKQCKEINAPGGHCFVTTNAIFWEKWEHWKVPRSIPHFLKRAAITHELFDMIIELRPSSTSAGIAENIKQLHLLEYKQRMLEYLGYFKSGRQSPLVRRNPVRTFSAPTDENGYGDYFISNDLITDLYLYFIAKGRKSESIEYCQTRTAISISLDNTFKSSAKATMVDRSGERESPMDGGVLSSLNQEGEGLSWRYCMSYSAAEIREMLDDLRKRHEDLGLPSPASVAVDNCCHVRRFIQEGLGQGTLVILDVYHFIIRYGAAIYNGMKNPRRKEVLADIRSAIIKTSAKKNQPATYWSQPEQEVRLVEAYNKWLQYGGIWSAAASKIHADQLEHVRKGCLARHREDIAMDGSRIEGSHKGWNSLQRAQPSGIEVYTGLAFDFFHRRNIRVGWNRVQNQRRGINCFEFVESTYSSHHVQLVDYTANLFNALIGKEQASDLAKHRLCAYPTLPQVNVQEKMGLVQSDHTITFGGLVNATANAPSADVDANTIMLEDIEAQIAEMDEDRFIRSLGVDQSLLHVPMNIQANGRQTATSAGPSANSESLNAQPPVHSQKRKEPSEATPIDMPTIIDCEDTDAPQNFKRQRTTIGPFSPGTQAAMVLSSSSTPGLGDVELDETLPLELDDVGNASDMVIDCAPTDLVTASDIALPIAADIASGSKSATGAAAAAHALFRYQTTLDNSLAISRPTNDNVGHSKSVEENSRQGQTSRANHDRNISLEDLRRPLPLPEVLRAKGLTRSQLLVSAATSIDPRSLKIGSDEDFFLFMDLRSEQEWTTFGMTAQKWAAATAIYNARLKEICRKKNITFSKKHPRALSDKLSEIEPKILDRISRNNYKSQRSNTEAFWRKHCAAVPALISKAAISDLANGVAGSQGKNGKVRKRAVCTRCETIMYTGNPNTNHKKGVCADGVRTRAKDGDPDPLPYWPQPQGIYKDGSMFNLQEFLFTIKALHHRICEDAVRNNPDIPADYTLEEQTFLKVLEDRTSVFGDHSYFLLYDLTFTTGRKHESLVHEVDGRRYLRLDCLSAPQ